MKFDHSVVQSKVVRSSIRGEHTILLVQEQWSGIDSKLGSYIIILFSSILLLPALTITTHHHLMIFDYFNNIKKFCDGTKIVELEKQNILR